MLTLIREVRMKHILNDLSQPVSVCLVPVKGCLYLFNDGGNLFGNALLLILVHDAVSAIPERIAVPILSTTCNPEATLMSISLSRTRKQIQDIPAFLLSFTSLRYTLAFMFLSVLCFLGAKIMYFPYMFPIIPKKLASD